MNHGRINDMIAETIERIVKSGYENAYVMTVSINDIYGMDDEVRGDLQIMIPDSVSDAGYDLVVDLYKICSVEPGGKGLHNGGSILAHKGEKQHMAHVKPRRQIFFGRGFRSSGPPRNSSQVHIVAVSENLPDAHVGRRP